MSTSTKQKGKAGKANKGFASMSDHQRRSIAKLGGKASAKTAVRNQNGQFSTRRPSRKR
jgi:hypothetical protein